MQPYTLGQQVRVCKSGQIFVIEECSWEPAQTEPKPIEPKEDWVTPPKDKKAAEKFVPFIPLPHPEPSYRETDGTWFYHHEIELV